MKTHPGAIARLKLGSIALAAAAITLLGAAIGVQDVHAATLLVTTTTDAGPDAPAPGSLRAALATAADGDTIDATGITGTITLLSGATNSAELVVAKSVRILGSGPANLTVDANHLSRVFRILTGLEVVIDGFTITNGRASSAPPDSFPPNSGGGIYNDHSILTVRNCHLVGNSAAESGGGIFNDGANSGSASLTVDHSTVSGNSADIAGGGITCVGYPSGVSTTIIVASTVSGNTCQFGGGGIYNVGADDDDPNSTTLTVLISTFSGNSVEGANTGGGAIFNRAATVDISSSTFSGNSAAAGGITSSGKLEIGNTILKSGFPGPNLRSGFLPSDLVTSHGFNLSSDDGSGYLNAATDKPNMDPKLGALADNGGATLTHLPLPGSPAIDQGSSDTLLAFGITTDQRGLARTVDDLNIANAFLGDGTDIGALEVGLAPPAQADLLVSLGVDKTSVKQGDQLTYTITVQNIGPDTATNVVVNNTLSSGTTFVSAKANKGSFTAPVIGETGTVSWQLGELANASQEAAQIQVTVTIKGKDTITNTATVQSDASDPNPANNSAALSVSVGAGGGKGGKR